MIIFNAGVPRSGTVLVAAIVRAICAAPEKTVILANPHGPRLPELLHTIAKRRWNPSHTLLVHTHSWDAESARLVAAMSNVTGFITHRDPRDVCVSLMTLHEIDFEAAVHMTLHSFDVFTRMAFATAWPTIAYSELVGDKAGQIRRIAAHLHHPLSTADIERIDRSSSVDKHRAIMLNVRLGKTAGIRERHNSRRTLREDSETLINDRHIQSGQPGRWRQELTPEQQAKAESAFATILDNLYVETRR
jgi:hypothetical protein